MNVGNQTFERETSTAGEAFKQSFEPVRDKASEAISFGERCVRNYPETAVWTTFGFGLLLGGIAGWLLGGRRQTTYSDELMDMVNNLRSKLHLG